MSAGNSISLAGPTVRPLRLLLVTLPPLVALFPPETRGEALAGAAALVALLAALRSAGPSFPGTLAIAVGLPLAVIWARAGIAPTAAVEPLSIATLALVAGVATASAAGWPGMARAVAVSCAASGAVVAGWGLEQRLWGLGRLAAVLAADPTLPDREALLRKIESGRAFAGFSTPAALGGFLALAIPIALALALEARGRRRALWLAGAGVQVAGLLAAASATATASLIAAAGLWAWLSRGLRRSLLWGALAAAVALTGIVALRGNLLDPGNPQSPWRLRAANLRAAVEMAREHPWLGVGPGGFAESYLTYRRPEDNETRHAHDLPLELAAEVGWPAGLALGVAFFVLFVGPLVAARRSGRPPWERGIAVGLGAFALHNLADYTAYMPSILWTAAMLRGSLARPANAAVPLPASARAARGMALAAALAAAVAVGLVGLSREARSAARGAAHEGDAVAALAFAERAARLAPWDFEAARALAEAEVGPRGVPALAPDERRVALEDADRAVRLSPCRASARELRARLRLAGGDLPGAFADLERAVRDDPGRTHYREARDTLRARLAPAPRPGEE